MHRDAKDYCAKTQRVSAPRRKWLIRFVVGVTGVKNNSFLLPLFPFLPLLFHQWSLQYCYTFEVTRTIFATRRNRRSSRYRRIIELPAFLPSSLFSRFPEPGSPVFPPPAQLGAGFCWIQTQPTFKNSIITIPKKLCVSFINFNFRQEIILGILIFNFQFSTFGKK